MITTRFSVRSNTVTILKCAPLTYLHEVGSKLEWGALEIHVAFKEKMKCDRIAESKHIGRPFSIQPFNILTPRAGSEQKSVVYVDDVATSRQ